MQQTVNASMNEATLVRRCVCGDEQAKALLFGAYRSLVRSSVWRTLAAHSVENPLFGEVDDITQEVFLRLLANNCYTLRSLKQPNALGSWLMRVAHNQAIDYIRKWSCRRPPATDDPWCGNREPCTTPTDSLAIARERKMFVESLLATLSREERIAVESFYVQGMKYVEIAEMMDANINTIASILRRAKLKLSRRSAEMGETWN